jgi:hypothetical protein
VHPVAAGSNSASEQAWPYLRLMPRLVTCPVARTKKFCALHQRPLVPPRLLVLPSSWLAQSCSAWQPQEALAESRQGASVPLAQPQEV